MSSERFQRQIERLLDEAEAAVFVFDWEKVRQCSQAVLAIDPENADGLTFLATVERALSESPEPPPSLEPAITTPPTPTYAGTPEAERRQLTVMFCDLQGSTALSQQLDPEELREVIRSYQELCAGAVSRFDGHIAKYLGDGLLIYFGYPQAHEDDPHRAVRGGLAILEGMGPLNGKLKADKDIELAVRIGVHTGLVVAGEMGGGDTIESLAIVGEAPNIAARLQEAAEPNSVVISDVTANLVKGFFVSKGLGFHELKGISEPMELFSVQSESGAQTRFDVAAAHLTPLVGREQELGLLLDRWEQAKDGLGQVVLLSGEAGIGKSRLIDALTERLAEERHTIRRLRCSAYHQNSALYPIIDFLELWLDFRREDTSEAKLGKLENAFERGSAGLRDGVPFLATLLSLPINGRYATVELSAERQRERTTEIVVELLMETGEAQQALLVVEDLHWADPSTLECLAMLVGQAATSHLLALFSFRPEFSPPWDSRAYMTPILLNRLTRRLASDLVDRLTGGKTLPEEIINQISIKCDGVPLFVEEVTRMVIESDLLMEVNDHYQLTGPLPPLAIPTTLQDSMTARLDSLGDAKEMAQLGAVLGREFSHDLIRAVSESDEQTLGRQLQQLIQGEFLYQRNLPPDSIYTFKHALIQDAAYESLLRTKRQQYHQQTARVLEERFADTLDAKPELLAHHYFEAGHSVEAVSYWLQAGESALSAYFWEEALANFQRALSAKNVAIKGSESAQDAEAAALLFGHGRAQTATLLPQELGQAVESLGRAFNFYVENGEVNQAVAVAEYPIPGFAFGVPSGMGPMIEKALTMVLPESLEAGRLLFRLGRVLGIEQGNYQGAADAFGRALAIATGEGDTSLEMRTLNWGANVDVFHLRPTEALEKG